MKPSIFRALTEIEHNLLQECPKAGLEAARERQEVRQCILADVLA